MFPASWRAGVVGRWRATGLVWVAVMLPAGAVGAQEVTVDRAALGSTATLMPAWRYMAADDARFAEPGFDDSRWMTVRPGQVLPGAERLRNEGALYTWARLRVRLPGGVAESAPDGLAVALKGLSVFSYAVYANGMPIGESPSFAAGKLRHAEPFAMRMPPGGEVVLAVRIFCPRFAVRRTFPIGGLAVGPAAGIATYVKLERMLDFNGHQTAELITVVLSLAIAVFAATLFEAQRGRREYLWLAALSVCYAGCTAMEVMIRFGTISADVWNLLLYRVLGCVTTAATLEFMPLLTRVRALGWARGVQGALLLLPLVTFYSDSLFAFLLLVLMALVAVLLGVYFVAGLRRRNPEALLMSVPLLLLTVATLVAYASIALPGRVPVPAHFYVGGLGMQLDSIPIWLTFLTLFGILQLRFVRVSRMEEQTTAELQAARTIQSLIVPDRLPEVAGLELYSVYKPALQVGGDFFQIVPLEDGALVAVGDVSGKGVPAAMTVALLVGTLRAVAEETESPAAVLAALNRSVVGRGSGFTTCVVLRVSVATHSVTAASAGHLNPYLDGREMELEAGLPLGITTDAEYSEQTAGFAVGERLTLVTDGVVEAFEPHTRELFGFERTLAASTLAAAGIAGRVERFTHGGQPTDDITIVTIAYEPGAGTAGVRKRASGATAVAELR